MPLDRHANGLRWHMARVMLYARHDDIHPHFPVTPFQGRRGYRAAFWFSLIPALGVAAFVYWPGLRGSFLFDDFANLPALGDFGPVDNWVTFWHYITSGFADPTGRPLALLSFLLDAHNWPADPYPFKRTNLILHLVNGVLLAMLLRRLGRILHGESRRVDLAAALGASLWLLHPLFVSTALYVVQREAMMPATFVLLGLIGWCKGRELAARGRQSGKWVTAISIIAGTTLGLASKANGVLLPLLCWLTDAIVLAPAQPVTSAVVRQRFAWIRRIVLVVPSICVLIWLAKQALFYALHGMPEFRSWTLGERLLTEARIVCDYLGLLWLPHPYTAGVFNDAFQVSTGLLSPPSTLAAIVLLVLLLAAAIAMFKRAPALALAILFYFAGQLLESTVLPLELYYEHRNYLPAMLMFWPFALWLTGKGHAVSVRRALIVILPLFLAGMTWMRADLWGNVRQQAEMWAEKNPESPRAQAYAAQIERANGEPEQAITRLRSVPVKPDSDLQIALNLIGAECHLGRVVPADIERAAAALRHARIIGQLGNTWFSEAIGRVASGKECPGLDVGAITKLLDAAATNPDSDKPSRRQNSLNLRGSLALAQHDPDSALRYYNQALDTKPNPAAGLQQAAQLGAAGYPAQGLAELNHLQAVWKPDTEFGVWSMPNLHAWLLRRDGYWANEIAHLRRSLQKDLAGKSSLSPIPEP